MISGIRGQWVLLKNIRLFPCPEQSPSRALRSLSHAKKVGWRGGFLKSLEGLEREQKRGRKGDDRHYFFREFRDLFDILKALFGDCQEERKKRERPSRFIREKGINRLKISGIYRKGISRIGVGILRRRSDLFQSEKGGKNSGYPLQKSGKRGPFSGSTLPFSGY